MHNQFPQQKAGVIYLSEGGTETEIMFRYGHELPHFAMFTLLESPKAVEDMNHMFQQYLDTVVEHQCNALMGGLDYRASSDWGKLLGYSAAGLKEMQIRCIEYLRDLAKPYQDQIPDILFSGTIGPRGDAYEINRQITPEEAEDYHSDQLLALKEAGADLAWAATFNNIPEAVGISRAAAKIGIPLYVSFTLDSHHRLNSGPTLKAAIETVDAETGDMRPDFYGINCSHPIEFEPALEPGNWFERVRSLRPNAAKMGKAALCSLDHLEDGDPVELGQQMGDLANRYPHLDIWGGCCGTWHTHLGEIAQNVKRYR